MSLIDVRHALISRATSPAPGAAIPVDKTWFENKRHMDGTTEIPPPNNALWYRILWVPGPQPNMDGCGAGARVRHTGFFQVNVCEPRDVGDVPMTAEAQRIMDCFKPGTNLVYNNQTVTITSCGMVKGLFDGTTGNPVVAVRVYWVADVNN